MPRDDELPPPAEVLRAACAAFGAVVGTITEERSWLPTDCAGWAVRDLVVHCLGDAQRGLVALHTPVDRAPDRDAATYWEAWRPDSEGAAAGRRFVRAVASMHASLDDICGRYSETVGALVHAAAGADADQPVTTQGHVLTSGDLMRTLAVEATVHHLDLVVSLPDAPAPSSEGLAEVRRTLGRMLGRPAPPSWDDAHYARAGTGRAPLSDADREYLGADADRFPLFG